MTGNARAAGADRVPVLMYHRVDRIREPKELRYCVEPARFAAHMHALASHGMWACAIDDFVAWLVDGSLLAPGAFLLTFDDGYLGVHRHVLPVLRELRWTATVFLVTSLVGGTDVWLGTDGASARRFALLGRAEIESMQGFGISFQSHARTHVDLAKLDDWALSEEIAGSRVELEELLAREVRYLAYPYGRFDDRAPAVARNAGYRAAFSVNTGFNRPGTDPYRIRRLDVHGTDASERLLRKVILGTNDGSWLNSARYYAGRLGARLAASVRAR